MMKCDEIAFADLLDADDDIESHHPDIARHLKRCSHCQSHLAGLAANDEQWDAVQHWLSTDENQNREYAESLDARERWTRPVAWDDVMAESLLSSASHPETLGRIGRYDVERLIGSGGMGLVFRAYDTAMCTGHPQFRSETSYAVLRRITDDTPRPIRESNPNVPTWLEQLVMKLLAKTADERFGSAKQVAKILEKCLAHVQQPTITPLPEAIAALSSGRCRLPPVFKFAAVAAFAFSLVFAGVPIVLAVNKGTLTIESSVDGVPIHIVKDGELSLRQSVGTSTLDASRGLPRYRVSRGNA